MIVNKQKKLNSARKHNFKERYHRNDILHKRNLFKSEHLISKMIKEIEELSNSLINMERKKEVDLDNSLPIIHRLALLLKEFRENKIKSEVSPSEIFKYYYSSFIISIILQTMRDKLIESKATYDNPIIALNSLKIIPNIKTVILELENKNPERLLPLTSELQLNATRNNLFKINPERLKEANEALHIIASKIELS